MLVKEATWVSNKKYKYIFMFLQGNSLLKGLTSTPVRHCKIKACHCDKRVWNTEAMAPNIVVSTVIIGRFTAVEVSVTSCVGQHSMEVLDITEDCKFDWNSTDAVPIKFTILCYVNNFHVMVTCTLYSGYAWLAFVTYGKVIISIADSYAIKRWWNNRVYRFISS